MKINHYCALLAAVLLTGPGCHKASMSDSVSLSTQTRAGQGGGFPTFPLNMTSDRLVAFDNGSGLNCMIAYDVVGGTVQLIEDAQPPTGNIDALWGPTNGLMVDGVLYPINTVTPSDEYNEVSGWHIIALDYSDNGRMDHIVAYCSGTGQAMVLSNTGPGTWHALYNSFNSEAGIAGYDLHGPTDKIIAYDMGSGHMDCLVCYRPGTGIFWVLQNQGGNGTTANYVAVVKSSGGVGGYDLKGPTDQIVAAYMDNAPATGSENLVLYRPGSEFIWALSHAANTTTWNAIHTSRSGLPAGGLNFSQTEDRMIPYDATGKGYPTWLFCYRPGTVNSGCTAQYTVAGGTFVSFPSGYITASPVLIDNPYSPLTYIGDKFIAINGNNGLGNSTLIDYEAGQSFNNLWLMTETNGGGLDYNLAYP